MTKLGLDFKVNCPHTSVEKLENGMMKVNLKDGTCIEADKVLCAIGRSANVRPLKLENAGVVVEKGAVKVDEF
jgi:glutathione reductase (NADPH)